MSSRNHVMMMVHDLSIYSYPYFSTNIEQKSNIEITNNHYSFNLQQILIRK